MPHRYAVPLLAPLYNLWYVHRRINEKYIFIVIRELSPEPEEYRTGFFKCYGIKLLENEIIALINVIEREKSVSTELSKLSPASSGTIQHTADIPV